MQPNLLDLYHGDNRDAQIDFVTLAQVGIWGIIHKASQGLNWKDPKFVQRVGDAHAAGLLCGAYHYLDASDAIKQASNFLESIARIGDIAKGNFLIAADYEKSADGNHPALHQLQDFMAYVDKNVPGTLCVLYSGDLIRETLKPVVGGHVSADMIGVSDFFRQHRLWLAEYGPHENIPWPWSETVSPVRESINDRAVFENTGAWLWQFNGHGRMPKIIGDTDLNYYSGTKEQLAAEWQAGPKGANVNAQNLAANRAYMGP